MSNERFSIGGLIAVGVSLALIAVGAAAAWEINLISRADSSAGSISTDRTEQSAYLVLGSLPSPPSSTKEQLAETLLGAFRANRLYVIEQWPVMNRNDAKIVLASPTVSGKAEKITCGSQNYPYCGLYLVAPTSTAFILWGEAMTGFQKVESFPDENHAILLNAWSLLNYSIAEHKELDLRTSTITPLLTLEVDLADDSAELHASGTNQDLSLLITGVSEKSRLRPKDAVIRDGSGKKLFSLPKAEVERLAKAALAGERKPSILVQPDEKDVDSGQINLLLFGQPYEFDMKTYRLTALTTD